MPRLDHVAKSSDPPVTGCISEPATRTFCARTRARRAHHAGRARSQPLPYRRVVSGAKTAVRAAAVASTKPMSPAEAVPSISPRDAFVRMEIGLTSTNASSPAGNVSGSTKTLEGVS